MASSSSFQSAVGHPMNPWCSNSPAAKECLGWFADWWQCYCSRSDIKPFVALDYVSGFWYASGWDAVHML